MIKAVLATSLLVAASAAMASSSKVRLSPEDRQLKKLLVGAQTSCEAPLVILGTQHGTLNGDRADCGNGVETLTLRGKPVHLRFADENNLSQTGAVACQSVYKYVGNMLGPVQYNVGQSGPQTFETSKVCVTEGSLTLVGTARAPGFGMDLESLERVGWTGR